MYPAIRRNPPSCQNPVADKIISFRLLEINLTYSVQDIDSTEVELQEFIQYPLTSRLDHYLDEESTFRSINL